jgi:Tfp pilus assembly protein PilF
MFGVCLGVAQESRGTLSERAYQEFRDRNFAAAERDFRELTKINPSDLHAQAYLGHALFRQEKFTEALGQYERARDIERTGTKLPEEEHRILVDQLVMSYGMGGQLNKARLLLEDAIRQDPDYPLNYYNLACAFAEEGDRGRMLANLDLAFQRKANVLKGEQMPDPRSDSSFQKYTRDPEFVSLMRKLGYR